MGEAAASEETRRAGARIAGLKVTQSVCPYCAVGCGQALYTRDGELVDIDGYPRSPINQGTLCPKARPRASSCSSPGRLTKVRYPRRRARAMPSRRNEKRFSRSAGARLTAWAAPRPSTP